MKKIGNMILFFVFLFSMNTVSAATFKVDARVDRNQMGIGDSFILNIHISGDEDFEIQEPKVPLVAGLELLNSWAGGKQSSSSMSVINGSAQFSKSVSQDFNYQFSPQKEGRFSIPILDVAINNQNYRTTPIKIDVGEQYRNSGKVPPKKGVPGRPHFPPGFDDEEDSPFGQMPDEEDLFSQLMKQRQRMFGQLPNGGQGFNGGGNQPVPSIKLDVNMNDAFFVYLDLDKTEAYEGEQVTANWSIYTRGNLESLDRVKFPDLKGFWKEIIEEVPALQFSPVLVNGVSYQRALLASHALFPIKAGTSVVDEFKVKGKVRTQTQFGWGTPNEFTKVSKRTSIKVLPLPSEGRTISFSGAVGTYRISLKIDGDTFPAHQPFSMKLRFEGVGNAKLIDLPTIAWPEGLEIFDTKNDSKFFKDGQSFKEFEILAIPRKEGILKIPPIQFSYFDPKQKKYVSQSTDEVSLKITPGQPQAGVGASSATGTPGKSLPEAEYKPLPILELPQSSFVFADERMVIYAGIALLLTLISLGQFFWGYRSLKQEPGLQKVIEAKINLIQQQKDQRRIGSESVNLIYLLAAFLAGQKKANQEWSMLVKEIPLQSQELLSRLTLLFDYFQILGFSPEDVMNQLVRQAPIPEKIKELKKIADEIATRAKLEEQG